MAEWFIGNKNVTLKEFKEYLKGDKNVVDVVEKEEEKIKSEEDKLFEELTNKVGFSYKRAHKVTAEFKSKKELIENIDELPFNEIENNTLVNYFGKKKKKKVKKTMEGEVNGND